MAASVRWTEGARDDLRDIWSFIARDSRRAAEATVDRLIDASVELAVFPDRGRSLPEFPELDYRELLIGSYRLIYRHAASVVWVLAVVHGRRQLREPPLR